MVSFGPYLIIPREKISHNQKRTTWEPLATLFHKYWLTLTAFVVATCSRSCVLAACGLPSQLSGKLHVDVVLKTMLLRHAPKLLSPPTVPTLLSRDARRHVCIAFPPTLSLLNNNASRHDRYSPPTLTSPSPPVEKSCSSNPSTCTILFTHPSPPDLANLGCNHCARGQQSRNRPKPAGQYSVRRHELAGSAVNGPGHHRHVNVRFSSFRPSRRTWSAWHEAYF